LSVKDNYTPTDNSTRGENPTPQILKEPKDKPIEIKLPVTSPKLLKWSGAIAPQKWMNFYSKVLTKFATNKDLKLNLKVEILIEGEITTHNIEDTKVALAELGLDNHVEVIISKLRGWGLTVK